MTPLFIYGLGTVAVLAVTQRRRLRRWARALLRAPQEPSPPASPGPYREAGGKAEPRDSEAPSLFEEPPAREVVYRRNRLVYLAIVMGGPLALTNVFIIPFFPGGPYALSAVLLGLAIPCATVIGARINRRHPTIPEGVALWSLLHHGALLWRASQRHDDFAVLLAALLASYAWVQAVSMLVAARVEPIAVSR